MALDFSSYAEKPDFSSQALDFSGQSEDVHSKLKGDIEKGIKEAVAKGQVYVKPIPGLSAQQTAGLYSWAEQASSTLRGIGQILGIHSEETKEEVLLREALENSQEYRKAAKIGSVAGAITDPVTYAIPLGKAATLVQFIKQSAFMGAGTGFVGASSTDGMEGRGERAIEGAAAGTVGGALLGSVMRAGGKLFGKDWLPWKASPEEKKAVEEVLAETHPDVEAKDVNHFLNAPEDAHINAKAKAEELIDSVAGNKKVEKEVKANPLVGHYLQQYRDIYKHLSARFGDSHPHLASYEQRLAKEVAVEAVKPVKEEIHPLAKLTDNIVRERVNNIMASDRIIKINETSLNEKVPEVTRREAISDAIDKGDMTGLSNHETAVANEVKGLFDDIGQRAQKLGIIEGLRENYISHIVDWSKVDKSEAARLKEAILGNVAKRENTSTSNKFGKERKHATFDDLQAAIKDTGLTIKTKDASEIYKTYASAMERTIENKRLIEQLKELQTSDEFGVNWAIQKVSDKSPPPQGWVHIDSPQMRGYVVNPEIADSLKFVFENNNPGVISQALLTMTQATKRMNVIGSLFHAKSLTEALYGNTGVLGTVKELGLMTSDKILKRKDAAINKALDNFRKGGLGDSTDAWLRNGLVVEVPQDVSIGVLGQLGKASDELLGKIGPKTTLGEKALTATEKATLGVFDKLTWDYLHTGLKLSVAEKMLEKAKKNHPEIPEAQHRTEIARHLNNSFGGLNWFDVASQSNKELTRRLSMSAFSPEGRRNMQLLMFAPDWTVSTLRAFTTALPKEPFKPHKWDIKGGLKGIAKPAKQADYARRYQMRTAFIYLTAINAMQQALTGRNLWDYDDPTRLHMDDGTSMQLMKHAAEPYHWMSDPDKTFSNKLGFLPRAAMTGLGGLEYASPTAPKMLDTSGSARVMKVLEGMVPFQVQAAMQAPEGEGLERALLGTLGVPQYGLTDEAAKQKREETRKARQQLINELKRKKEEQR